MQRTVRCGPGEQSEVRKSDSRRVESKHGLSCIERCGVTPGMDVVKHTGRKTSSSRQPCHLHFKAGSQKGPACVAILFRRRILMMLEKIGKGCPEVSIIAHDRTA